jgi:hypothetical protein
MSLFWLAILLGGGYGGLHAYGLVQPDRYREEWRKFSRSGIWGTVLMLLATAWFVWNLYNENISDFAKFKPFLMAGFAGVGIGSCFYLRDFLAVRGMAILFLLLGKVMVDTARWVESEWRLLVVVWAYALVVGGIWLTVSPYRFRDWVDWWTQTVGRMRAGVLLRVVLGVTVLVLGVTVFRG